MIKIEELEFELKQIGDRAKSELGYITHRWKGSASQSFVKRYEKLDYEIKKMYSDIKKIKIELEKLIRELNRADVERERIEGQRRKVEEMKRKMTNAAPYTYQ